MDNNELTIKITELIKGLYIDEPIREGLLKEVADQGVSEELIAKVRKHIEESVQKFEQEAQEELKAFETSLNETVGQVEQQYQQAVVQAKEAAKQHDAEEMEKIRKQLSSL